jgi:hypothetical protein
MTPSGEGLQLTAPRRRGSALTHVQEGQARVSLLKEIKLSDDCRAHALILGTTGQNGFPTAAPCNQRSRPRFRRALSPDSFR